MARAIELVTIELDKPRSMLLTQGALMYAEREINRQRGLEGTARQKITKIISDELSQFDSGFSADFTLVILWASLLHEEPALTLQSVGNLATNIMDVMAKVGMCIKAAFFPDSRETVDEEAAEEEPQPDSPLARPNGSNNGPSVVSN